MFDARSGSSDDTLSTLQTGSTNGTRGGGGGAEGTDSVAPSTSRSSGEVILGPSPPNSVEPPITTTRPSILGDSSDSEDDLLDS